MQKLFITVIPRQDALKTPPAPRHGLRYPSAPSTPLRPVGEQQAAVTPRRRTDKCPQAIFRPAAVDQSDSRFRRGHDVRETAGVLPAPGRLLRASITNAAPSVRTSRRGSVLAAASHKSSAAVSSSAAGSNTARYFTPGGTGTSASGAAKATATPHFRASQCGSRPEGGAARRHPARHKPRILRHPLRDARPHHPRTESESTCVADSCGFTHPPPAPQAVASNAIFPPKPGVAVAWSRTSRIPSLRTMRRAAGRGCARAAPMHPYRARRSRPERRACIC